MKYQTFTLTDAVVFVTETCCNCGVVYAVTQDFERSRRRDKDRFYCPNGHSQVYVGKSDRELAEEARRELRRVEVRLQVEVDQRKAADRELKRLRQRAKAGACPCCNRTFVQLSRHIKSQHPGYQP